MNELLDAGIAVLLEIDWQGARQVRQTAPEAVSIFILPPSVQELERRLRARATDTEAVIDRRLADAVSDMGHWDEFDYVVVNDVFDDALDALDAILAGRGESFATSRADVRAAVTRIIHG